MLSNENHICYRVSDSLMSAFDITLVMQQGFGNDNKIFNNKTYKTCSDQP